MFLILQQPLMQLGIPWLHAFNAVTIRSPCATRFSTQKPPVAKSTPLLCLNGQLADLYLKCYVRTLKFFQHLPLLTAVVFPDAHGQL